MHERNLLALAASVSLLAAPIHAQDNAYSGFGFVEQPPLAGSRAQTVALTDVAGSALPDLAILQDDGTLYLNLDATEYGTSGTITGIEGLAATRDGLDRLWATDGARILSVGWDDQLDAITLTGPPTVHLTGEITLFRTQERPGGSRLLTIDYGGGRAQVFELVAGSWTATRTLWADGGQGIFHDLAAVDWLNVGAVDLAVTTNLGLQVVSSSNATLYSESAGPNNSWVEVLHGNRAAWSRDLLFWHRRHPASGAASLLVANAVHSEIIPMGGLALENLAFADFLNAGDGHDEVVLSRGDERLAWILEQDPGPSPQDPIFALDPASVPFVDLSAAEQPLLTHPAPLDARDVDGDGDEDLVFVNDLFEGLWVLSSSVDEQALRPVLTSSGSPTVAERSYSFLIEVGLPVGDSYEWEIYHQPNPSANVVFLNGGSGSAPSLLLTATLPAYSEAEVTQFLVRAVDSGTGTRYPAQIEYWSTNTVLFSSLQSAVTDIYRWVPVSGEASGAAHGRDGHGDGSEGVLDPGGTTPRPKINPGP